MVRFIAGLILLLTLFIFGTISEKKQAKEYVPINDSRCKKLVVTNEHGILLPDELTTSQKINN